MATTIPINTDDPGDLKDLMVEIARSDKVEIAMTRSSEGKGTLETLKRLFAVIEQGWMDNPSLDVVITYHPAERNVSMI